MKIRKDRIQKYSSLLLVCVFLTGCATTKAEGNTAKLETNITNLETNKTIDYEIEPETFSLSVPVENGSIPVSLPGEKKKVEQFVQNQGQTSWEYTEDKIGVSIDTKSDYIHVTITSKSKEDNEFVWPNISGETYYIPFGEGKKIPQEDTVWSQYLKGNKFHTLEQLSMPFWATVYDEYAVLFIMENPYRNDMLFSENHKISFSLQHEYPEIDTEKENSFRIYITENNPVSIAKIYREYVKQQNGFVSLKQKAEQNPNIKKLYGAPQIYMAGENIIAPENINWSSFLAALDSTIMQYMIGLSSEMEQGQEFNQVIETISKQDYVDVFQKNIICGFLSEVLKRDDFYNETIFTAKNDIMKELEQKKIETLSESDKIQYNKHALAVNLQKVFKPAEKWMDRETVDLIKEMKESGLNQAWIGLNSWEQAYTKPEMVETAAKQGYLIGPYDSYHSIHKPNEEQWITAKFSDDSLYENATVTKKDGTNAAGFKNVGRKLNPTLSFPSVEQRVKEILSNEILFNSWFIDCDATGEIYDDYTPEHITTQQEDLAARLKRMAYIRDTYDMVIGSEGGNDFAASTIAFAHGIEMKSFSWMDEDMSKNKDSKYYIGKYYNKNGGVAEHFSKRIPLKEMYYTIFVNPSYDIPLFKLVYNDSVITSYHWDWSTFKIMGATQDRMLREVLYNVAPLYHLDYNEWQLYKNDIIPHTTIWSEFSQKVIEQEMTDFKYLSEDGFVQLTQYGDAATVVANFSDTPFLFHEKEIPSHSVLLNMDGKDTIYTPVISENNQ